MVTVTKTYDGSAGIKVSITIENGTTADMVQMALADLADSTMFEDCTLSLFEQH